MPPLSWPEGRQAPFDRRELFSIVQFGVPGTSHIPYEHLLSDKEIQAIVHYQLQGMCSNGCEH